MKTAVLHRQFGDNKDDVVCRVDVLFNEDPKHFRA